MLRGLYRLANCAVRRGLFAGANGIRTVSPAATTSPVARYSASMKWRPRRIMPDQEVRSWADLLGTTAPSGRPGLLPQLRGLGAGRELPDRTRLDEQPDPSDLTEATIIRTGACHPGCRRASATASEHHRFRDIPGPWKTGHGKLAMENWPWKTGHGKLAMENWPWKTGHGKLGSLGFGVLLRHLRSAPNG